MRKTLGAVAVLAILLAGCGSEDAAGDAPKPTTGGGTLADITGEQLCAMVDTATIERQFGESIENALGGRNEHQERDSTSCSYVTESLMTSDTDDILDALTVGTNVRNAVEKASTAEAALEGYLVDDDGKTVAYTPVDGLGTVAGYAGADLGVRQGGAHLVAIVEDDGKFVEVTTKVEPDATLDQLKPIATELVEGVEAALR